MCTSQITVAEEPFSRGTGTHPTSTRRMKLQKHGFAHILGRDPASQFGSPVLLLGHERAWLRCSARRVFLHFAHWPAGKPQAFSGACSENYTSASMDFQAEYDVVSSVYPGRTPLRRFLREQGKQTRIKERTPHARCTVSSLPHFCSTHGRTRTYSPTSRHTTAGVPPEVGLRDLHLRER